MSGAKIATNTRNSTTAPPAMATLSRLSRVHAMQPNERPSMRRDPAPLRTASGSPIGDVGDTTSGPTVMRPRLPYRSTEAHVTAHHVQARDTDTARLVKRTFVGSVRRVKTRWAP